MTQLRRISAAALFPTLVLAAICNQPRQDIDLLALGQIASVLTILFAAAILVGHFRHRVWPWLVIGLVALLRSQREAMLLSVGGDIPYSIAASIMFAAAGAILIARYPRLVREQMTAFLVLSFPLMVIQLLGVGAWAHVLRTDLHVLEDQLFRMVPVLFVSPEAVIITTLQARPAGFLHANNFMSLFLAFGLGIYLGRPTRGRLTLVDVAVLGVLTLAMSKTAFVVFAVMLVLMVTLGDRSHRRYAANLAVMFIVEVGVYAVLFPGLFAYTLSPELALINLQLRVADILLATGIPVLIDLAYAWVPLAAQSIAGQVVPSQSAYALIAAGGLAAIVVIGLAIPVYMRVLRNFGQRFPERRMTTILCSAALACVPAMSTFLGSSAMAFMAGFALMPLLVLWEPRFAKLFADAPAIATQLSPSSPS